MRDLDVFLKNIVANDRKLADEIRTKSDAIRRELAKSRTRAIANGESPDVAVRTIVLRTGRPVLPIVRNTPKLEFADASDSQVWRARLEKAEARIKRAAQAVGRVEVAGHPLRLSAVGTGWLVEPTTIVTNRHVAREFGRNGAADSVSRRASTTSRCGHRWIFSRRSGAKNGVTSASSKFCTLKTTMGRIWRSCGSSRSRVRRRWPNRSSWRRRRRPRNSNCRRHRLSGPRQPDSR